MKSYIRVYEEYESKQERNRACRLTKPKGGKATGLARGYLLVCPEDGLFFSGKESCYTTAIGELMSDPQPGDEPRQLYMPNPSHKYLRENCRRISFHSMPDVWQIEMVKFMYGCINNDAEQWFDRENDSWRKMIIKKKNEFPESLAFVDTKRFSRKDLVEA